jgi:hypothetical protein
MLAFSLTMLQYVQLLATCAARSPSSGNEGVSLYTIPLESAVVGLKSAKQSIPCKEELLVVVVTKAMMVVVSSTTRRQSKGHHVLGCPGKVKATVQFREQKDNNQIVQRARHGMCTQHIESDNRKAHFQDFFGERQAHNVTGADFGRRVVFGMHGPIEEWYFVHEHMTTEKEGIVQEKAGRHIAHDAQRRWRSKRGEASMTSRGQNIPRQERYGIHQQFKQPRAPVPRRVRYGRHGVVVVVHSMDINTTTTATSGSTLTGMVQEMHASSMLIGCKAILQSKLAPGMSPPLFHGASHHAIGQAKTVNVHGKG